MMDNENYKYLFHYSKMSNAIEYILSNNELKFSKFDNLNDPWENRRLIIDIWQGFSFVFNEAFARKCSNSSILFNNAFYDNSYLFCFSINKYSDDRKNKIREGYSLFRMWAQYADCSKGVCLVFNRRKLISSC